MWVIERKASMSAGKTKFLKNASKRPGVDPKAVEEYRSAQSGKHVIHYVKELDSRVHDFLWFHDLQRQGNGPTSQVALELKGFDRDIAKRREVSHELAVRTSDVLHNALKRQSSKIHAGRIDEVILEGFGVPRVKGTTFLPPAQPPQTLFDAFSRPVRNLHAKTPKIHLATR